MTFADHRPFRNVESARLDEELGTLASRLQALRIAAGRTLDGTIGQHDIRRSIEAIEDRFRAISKELRKRRKCH